MRPPFCTFNLGGFFEVGNDSDDEKSVESCAI